MYKSKRLAMGVLLSSSLAQVLIGGTARADDAAAPSATANTGLEEITVTASRREESQSKVAISVTAFTQKTLDENTVRTVDDIAKLTPGVSFSRTSDASGSVASIAIRGISSDAGSGATGVYIDDTPIQSRDTYGGLGSSVWPQIFDLERVEILRGPQGTLFGAGSEGGTVRMITPQPSTTKFQTYARSDIAFTQGGDPSTELGAAVNVPLIDNTLGMRVSASYRHDGGYVNRIDFLTGNVQQSGSNYFTTSTFRVAVAYKPTDNVTVTPSFFWQDQYVNDSSNFWLNASDPGSDSFNRSSVIRNNSHDRFSLPSLKVEWGFSGATLTSNTSYFERDQPGQQDLAYFESYIWAGQPIPPAGMFAPSYNDIHQRNFTQEIRLQSADSDSRLTWLTGIFYTNNWQHVNQKVQDTFLPNLFNSNRAPGSPTFEQIFGGLYKGLYTVDIDPFNTVDKQLAWFGQADYKVTDKLKVTVGLRYAKLDSSAEAHYAGPIVGPEPIESKGTTSEKPLTPKYGLSYQLTEGTMLYGTVAKGYRAGGYNNPLPLVSCAPDLANVGLSGQPEAFKSDSLWSYEIGSKSRAFDGRLAIDASAYRIKWKNIQFTYTMPTCGFSVTTNAGEATSTGFELSVMGRPIQALELGLAIGYVNAKYDENAFFNGTTPADPNTKSIVADGNRILVSPWTVSVQAQYSFNVLEHESYFRVNYNYADGVGSNLPVQDNRTGSFDPDIPGLPVTNDLSLKLGTYFGPVNAALYVNNATNQHPLLNVSHASAGDPLFMAATVRPRTVGLTAIYRF